MLKRYTFGLVRDPEMVMVEYGLKLLPIAGKAFLPSLSRRGGFIFSHSCVLCGAGEVHVKQIALISLMVVLKVIFYKRIVVF